MASASCPANLSSGEIRRSVRAAKRCHLHIYADRPHDISEAEFLRLGSMYLVKAAQNIIFFAGQLPALVHLIDGELAPGR